MLIPFCRPRKSQIKMILQLVFFFFFFNRLTFPMPMAKSEPPGNERQIIQEKWINDKNNASKPFTEKRSDGNKPPPGLKTQALETPFAWVFRTRPLRTLYVRRQALRYANHKCAETIYFNHRDYPNVQTDEERVLALTKESEVKSEGRRKEGKRMARWLERDDPLPACLPACLTACFLARSSAVATEQFLSFIPFDGFILFRQLIPSAVAHDARVHCNRLAHPTLKFLFLSFYKLFSTTVFE